MVLFDDTLEIKSFPKMKDIKSIQLPPFIVDVSKGYFSQLREEVSMNAFLKWGPGGNQLAVHGKGLWVVNLPSVLKNLELAKEYSGG